MITPKNDHSLKRRCTCPPKIDDPIVDVQANRVASIVLSIRTSLVGMWPNSHSPGSSLIPSCQTLGPEQPPTITLEASHGRNRSLESLKYALSSRGGRESLHTLPTEQAVGVIDVLEQVSTKRLGRVITS